MVQSCGRVLLLCAVVFSLGLISPAHAGTATATAHSHDFSPVFDLTVSPASTHPTFAYVDTGSVDTLGAHSRAWSAATVTGGVLRKSTGGEGWYVNGASPKHFTWYASAGTGSYYLTAPAGVTAVPLQVRILESNNPDIRDFAVPSDAPQEVGAYPSQGFFAEYKFDVHFGIASSTAIGPTGDVNLDGVTNAEDLAFVDVRLGQAGFGLLGDLNNDQKISELDLEIIQQNLGANGFDTRELLTGQARLGGPESGLPPLVATGDLANAFTVTQAPSPNPGQLRLVAASQEPVLSPIILLPVNVPFTLNLDQFMTYGGLEQGEDPDPFDVPAGLVASVSGALVSEVFLGSFPGQAPFQIRAVPASVPGDTNFDGVVDLEDLNNVRNNFGSTSPSTLGDTNGDGKVNLEDLNAVRNNFGAGGRPAPEPGTFILAALGLVMGLWGKRLYDL